MTATELGTILVEARKDAPKLLVIDSIQTMYNSELETAAGSVGQVRECTAKLLNFAKESNIAIIIIGHVTKEGNIAGPRLLEHMVDVVLNLKGIVPIHTASCVPSRIALARQVNAASFPWKQKASRK